MIETERLIVRSWRDSDRAPFAALNADPEVRRYLGPVQTQGESDAVIERLSAIDAKYGHTFWAVERRADGAFLGFCGLIPWDVTDDARLEIGWRLARAWWGQGYAREAAVACLDWAWANTSHAAVHAITVPANTASWGLMERLGMQRLSGGDFDHPGVPDGSPLKRHITYRIDRPFINHLR